MRVSGIEVSAPQHQERVRAVVDDQGFSGRAKEDRRGPLKAAKLRKGPLLRNSDAAELGNRA
jgi:hypothetical protein